MLLVTTRIRQIQIVLDEQLHKCNESLQKGGGEDPFSYEEGYEN